MTVTQGSVLTQMSPASLQSVVLPMSELLLCQYLSFQIINFYETRTSAKKDFLRCLFLSSLPCRGTIGMRDQ